MGANDKVAATFHVRECTPRGYMIRVNDDKGNELLSILSDGTVQGELENASQAAKIFMSELRGLTEIIHAEAKAEALNEAYNYGLGRTGHVLHRWLRDRANQYKEEQ